MRIVFVHLGREHLGIEYLSSALKQKGHKVYLVYDSGLFSREDNVFYSPFLRDYFKKKNIAAEVMEYNPDMVGFSPYTSNYIWCKQKAKEIKQISNVPIVFGGIHTTLVPDRVVKDESIDFAIVGEAEEAFVELVGNFKNRNYLKNVKNLYFKEEGRIIKNLSRSPVENLDNLPFPDKELFGQHIRIEDDYVIMTSRGCPYRCSYCCESFLRKIYGGKYFRRRSVENVIQELKIMKAKYEFKEVMFFDSILFTEDEWLYKLLEDFSRYIKVPFRCTGHVSFLDYKKAELMKKAGCYCIDFGVQTFNQEVRKKILNRSESNQQIKKAFDICDKVGLKYDVDLMFGLPGIHKEDYFLPLDFLKNSTSLNRIKCYYLSYFPNTEIINKAKELKILNKDDILKINQGYIGDWFHLDSIKNVEHKRLKNIFTKIYKIYPLLPRSLRNKIQNGKLYYYFKYLPNFVVILLQLLIGLKNKDYRFIIYIKIYLFHFKKTII